MRSRTVGLLAAVAVVVIVGLVLLGVLADASFGGIAAIVAAVAFGASMLGLMSLLLTLVGTVRELTVAVERVTDETVPLLGNVAETVAGVNTELARVDAIMGSVQHVSRNAERVSDVVSAAVANPVIKAMAFVTGTRAAIKVATKIDVED